MPFNPDRLRSCLQTLGKLAQYAWLTQEPIDPRPTSTEPPDPDHPSPPQTRPSKPCDRPQRRS